MRRPSDTSELPHDIEDLAVPPRHAALHGGKSMAMRKSASTKTSSKKRSRTYGAAAEKSVASAMRRRKRSRA